MLVLGLSKAKNAVAAIWGAANSSTHADLDFDASAREPLHYGNLSEIFVVKFKQPAGVGFTKREQRECDTMSTLRQILYD